MKIVVPVMAGIGNAVMAVPMVRALGKLGDVTIEAGSGAIADVFSRLEEVADVATLPTSAFAGLRAHRALCKLVQPQVYVVPFPSNRWQYTLLVVTSGADRATIHDYPVGRWKAARGVFSESVTLVDAVDGLHDVRQNLRLAESIASGPIEGIEEAPIFPVTDIERDAAAMLHEGDGFVAIHPGCGQTKVGEAKRLPTETLSAVVDALVDRGRTVVIVEGPDERGVGTELAVHTKSRPPVIQFEGTLGESAALLERAALFIGTDSGLGHVSAALGVPTISIFTAGDPDRVCPFGHRHLVVTPPEVNGAVWSPRLMYPMRAAGPKLRNDGIDWASHVRVEDILAAVDRAGMKKDSTEQAANESQPTAAAVPEIIEESADASLEINTDPPADEQ